MGLILTLPKFHFASFKASDLHVNDHCWFVLRADDIASDFMLSGVQGVQCIHGDR